MPSEWPVLWLEASTRLIVSHARSESGLIHHEFSVHTPADPDRHRSLPQEVAAGVLTKNDRIEVYREPTTRGHLRTTEHAVGAMKVFSRGTPA
jgi:hypothetical protein